MPTCAVRRLAAAKGNSQMGVPPATVFQPVTSCLLFCWRRLALNARRRPCPTRPSAVFRRALCRLSLALRPCSCSPSPSVGLHCTSLTLYSSAKQAYLQPCLFILTVLPFLLLPAYFACSCVIPQPRFSPRPSLILALLSLHRLFPLAPSLPDRRSASIISPARLLCCHIA